MRSPISIPSSFSLTTILLSTTLPTSLAASLVPQALRDVASTATSIVKRAENTTTIPLPIVVAPSQYWDGVDGPWSSFALQVGTPAQNVRVMVSTAGAFTWTISDGGCPPGYVDDCINSRGFIFQTNKSLTWVANSIFNFNFENNLGMDTNGNTGFDTATLGWQGAGGPTVAHSTVFNVNSAQYWIGGFGLNPAPTNFTTFVDPQPSFMQQLKTNNMTPSLAYGYTAGNQYRNAKVFGSLVLGGYDENRFDKTQNISVPFYDDISRDLLVTVKTVSTSQNGTTLDLLPTKNIEMFIDSTVPTIWLPTDACERFELAFGLEWNEDLNMYLVNDSHHDSLLSSNPSVTFTLASNDSSTSTVDIVLPYGAFDLTLEYPYITSPNTSYYFPLQRADNDTQYTLGRTFLQEAYLIADYDRKNFTVAPCTWEQTTNESIKSIYTPGTGPSESLKGSSFPTAAIAGIVVGVVILIAILGAVLWFLRRRKNTEKRRVAELEAKEADQAKHSSEAGETKPFISNPIGGELGGGEIHELTAPHKPFAQEMESPHKVDPNKAGYSEMEGGEYFGPGKGFAHEVDGSGPAIFEMPGSDVHEMPAPEHRPAEK
ncbi:hypothetical protein LTR10_009526 [Elasticomyces elasticus]|nr:hypothetical protein LTR10_009526 [Elasticomyces elasticus]KAK4971378.1 hypothetical protein LTR42_007105 [Elasticomyces elasticus]